MFTLVLDVCVCLGGTGNFGVCRLLRPAVRLAVCSELRKRWI